MSTSCCWYIIFYFVWTEYSNKCHIIIQIYIYIYIVSTAKQFGQICQTVAAVDQSCKPDAFRQTSLNAPLRTEMCPSPLWTVHRGTLHRHHRGHRWLSVRITPSARRRLAHRLKATSHGIKWVQMASFSRKMSPSAFSRRCQAPPGGKIAQMARHGVTRKGWQVPRPGWTPRDSGVNTHTIYWLMTS